MAKDELGLKASKLFEKARKQDWQSLSRLLTLVENHLFELSPFLAELSTDHKSLRVGITGPPGAGKSSLINEIVKFYAGKGLRIGVLAIDPSSPFSGGALLGDRVRMESLTQCFIRSLGSRGAFGGLSAATGAMALILEAVGFDVVIIETAGVGQTELQIMNLADVTAVVLVPESGDFVQTLKAGILEIADLFVVNKSDRPGSEIMMAELKALIQMEGERERPLMATSTVSGSGLENLAESLLKVGYELRDRRRKSTEHKVGQLQNLALAVLQEQVKERISKIKIENPYKALLKLKLKLPS